MLLCRFPPAGWRIASVTDKLLIISLVSSFWGIFQIITGFLSSGRGLHVRARPARRIRIADVSGLDEDAVDLAHVEGSEDAGLRCSTPGSYGHSARRPDRRAFHNLVGGWRGALIGAGILTRLSSPRSAGATSRGNARHQSARQSGRTRLSEESPLRRV